MDFPCDKGELGRVLAPFAKLIYRILKTGWCARYPQLQSSAQIASHRDGPSNTSASFGLTRHPSEIATDYGGEPQEFGVRGDVGVFVVGERCGKSGL